MHQECCSHSGTRDLDQKLNSLEASTLEYPLDTWTWAKTDHMCSSQTPAMSPQASPIIQAVAHPQIQLEYPTTPPLLVSLLTAVISEFLTPVLKEDLPSGCAAQK